MKLAHELGGDAHAVRAADLLKCDLTTELVKEFTELQGVVGGLYARAQGEPGASVAGDLRPVQAGEHGRCDSAQPHGADWSRWPTSWIRCAAVSASA